MNRTDFVFNLLIPFVFQGTDMNHHINFLRAVCNRILCFEYLGSRCVIAVRKTDNGTDCQPALYIFRSFFHIGRRNARGCASICNAIVKYLPDIFPFRCHAKQGVVYNA